MDKPSTGAAAVSAIAVSAVCATLLAGVPGASLDPVPDLGVGVVALDLLPVLPPRLFLIRLAFDALPAVKTRGAHDK
jgi:hypothetical protein